MICNVLRRNPRILLLFRGPDTTEGYQRVVAEAAARGIPSWRILFTHGYVSARSYHQRILAADLILDTTPFGAHSLITTPLTIGVPLLALQGDDRVGRVGPG